MSYKALNLDNDEHVIFEVRRHWIVFVEYAVGLLFSAIFPFVLLTTLRIFFPKLLLVLNVPGNGYALLSFAYTIWLLILWISFFVNWTTYYLDVWYVTEKRIIAIDQRRIFSREVSNLRFDKIQDVTIDVRGFIATFLDFGSIKVQTASEDSREFFMRSVRRPEEVKRIIFTQHNVMSDKK